MNLSVKKGRLELASPLVGASGLFGYGREHEGLLDYASFGAIVTKTITLAPREGNPPPRLVDVGSGIINSIGLENVGVDAFIAEHLPGLDLPCRVFVSIGGAKVEEYSKLAGMMEEVSEASRISALEVNISCPNVKQGGIAFGQDAASTREVVSAVRKTTELPLIVKVPPLISGIEEVCGAACDAGADALTVANTYPAMAIDIERARPVLGAVSGGLSGGAIKPVSLLLVWKVARCVNVPVLAGGGIETAGDAIEYILAGAHALQIGSLILKDTGAPDEILKGLTGYMKKHGYKRIDDFRGKAAG